jgi:hypothetical protein
MPPVGFSSMQKMEALNVRHYCYMKSRAHRQATLWGPHILRIWLKGHKKICVEWNVFLIVDVSYSWSTGYRCLRKGFERVCPLWRHVVEGGWYSSVYEMMMIMILWLYLQVPHNRSMRSSYQKPKFFAIVIQPILFTYPLCNFSSTLYPQSCWCIIQVIHSL